MANSTWQFVVDAATAIGTLGVAALAIWGERVRAWLVPPQLSLQRHNFEGDLTAWQDGTPVMHYHLRVVNARDWQPARNCRVVLRGVSRRGPDNIFHRSPLTVPPQLVWAPASLTSVLTTVTKDAVVDLGRVAARKDGQTRFEPMLYSVPNNFAGFVGAGEAVRYELGIEAENYSSAKDYVVEIAWDGVFPEPGKHVHIREVPEAAS